jgi:hypothetical protein
MRITKLIAVATLAVLAAGSAACRSKQIATTPGTLGDSTTVVVDNRALYDMTIYVLEGSIRQRLGTASAVSTTRLGIPRTAVGNGRDLQFLADPFAGQGNSVTQRIYVKPGDQVSLTIIR